MRRALARGRSFVNYFADRVIRCGENRERGDRARRSVGGKGRERERERKGERHGVGVRMMSAILERHSGISAAPTAGLRGAMSRVTSRSAHVLYGAAPRRDARYTHGHAHGALDTDALDFYSIYIGRLDPGPRKKTRARESVRSNDLRRRPAIVANPSVPSPRAKIYIQFIFKMRAATLS